jgi:Transglycosylase SLT domain
MRRLVVLLGTVVALVLSGTASADTFVVVHPAHPGTGLTSGPIPFTSSGPAPQSLSSLQDIWQAAGSAYGIPWQVLAAINKVETDFGRNLGPSSAGAVGWMQFMPSTWQRWGIDANGDGVADPNNPTDAIFSAARYLAACGGQANIGAAIYCYNHADWYVNEVLALAAAFGRGGGSGLFTLDRLQARLLTARTQVAGAKTELENAVAKARRLARAGRRFLRKASTAKLVSGQLAAQRRAVQIGVRRDALVARIARLRGQLDAATSRLSTVNQASSLSIVTSSGSSTSLQLGRVDQGVDITSYLPYAALASGTVVYIDPNFWQGTPAV